MNRRKTSAGTDLFEMTTDEHRVFVDREVQRALGMTSDEFLRLARDDRVDWSDPDVFYVAGLVGLGQ